MDAYDLRHNIEALILSVEYQTSPEKALHSCGFAEFKPYQSRPSRRIPQEKENKIIELNNNNYNDIEISKILDMPRETVRGVRLRNNLPARGKK